MDIWFSTINLCSYIDHANVLDCRPASSIEGTWAISDDNSVKQSQMEMVANK